MGNQLDRHRNKKMEIEMPLQMLSHRDGVRRRTNEGFIPTSFPELPPVPGFGEHRIGSRALLAWLGWSFPYLLVDG